MAAKDALPFAVVFQEASIDPWMKVRSNVEFAFDSLAVPRDEVRKRVAEQLEHRRALQNLRRRLPSPALQKRHEAARRYRRPGVRRIRSTGPVHGRTLRSARRTDARRHGGRTDAHLGTHPQDGRLRDARHRRSRFSRGPLSSCFRSRLGRVKEIIPIDFPRPRDPVKLRGEPKFGEYVVKIWELLR